VGDPRASCLFGPPPEPSPATRLRRVGGREPEVESVHTPRDPSPVATLTATCAGARLTRSHLLRYRLNISYVPAEEWEGTRWETRAARRTSRRIRSSRPTRRSTRTRSGRTSCRREGPDRASRETRGRTKPHRFAASRRSGSVGTLPVRRRRALTTPEQAPPSRRWRQDQRRARSRGRGAAWWQGETGPLRPCILASIARLPAGAIAPLHKVYHFPARVRSQPVDLGYDCRSAMDWNLGGLGSKARLFPSRWRAAGRSE